MKNILFLVLLSITFVSLPSCSKDDDSCSTTYTSSTPNNTGGSTQTKTYKEIITTNTWKFTQLLINNKDVNFGSYDQCEIDNEWLFRGQGYEIISRGNICKNGESNGGVYASGTWTMVNDNDVTMKIDNEQFTIINISNSQIRIRVKRKPVSSYEDWDYIYSAK